MALQNNVLTEDLYKLHPELSKMLWDGVLDYSEQINEAFNILKFELRNRGIDTDKIPSTETAFDTFIKYKALEIIFLDFTSRNDMYYNLYVKYRDEVKYLLENVVYNYDLDDSGEISDNETNINPFRIRFER